MVGHALAFVAAIALDRLLGEPRAWHPLVGFGRFAASIERQLNRGSAARRRCAGVVAALIACAPWVALAALLRPLQPLLVDAVALYLALGLRSLDEHAHAVQAALSAHDLEAARHNTARMVSRDTAAMTEPDVARATVESVLENGNDAVFGALFWALVAGAPGVVQFRLANTLDAMWGYRNVRFEYFGWCAARLDDALNYVPARLTALSYALVGRTADALACWRTQARRWSSPNAGPVMSAGAGSLGIRLGGAASYGGCMEQRPDLGCGRAPAASDIARSRALVRRAVALWVIVVGAFSLAVDLLEWLHA
ncbi:adenosylcobinamide-phosphate synthase CbiB [Uliginosibacterium sp. sgz301328]|uniref:adenosylcobinamide-phosphate synthase CbiB n=1 Tax=Uliginosibacterium sp. sgz301328 TaxID=3243764 RepID=UPI00359EA178